MQECGCDGRRRWELGPSVGSGVEQDAQATARRGSAATWKLAPAPPPAAVLRLRQTATSDVRQIMLRNEAEWLARIVHSLPSTGFPLLDLGSSTGSYRTTEQDFIASEIFGPLLDAGHRVIHADLKTGAGVDVVIDFTRADDRRRLAESAESIGCVLCANMLEHLSIAPDESAQYLLDLCRPGQYLLVTVPKSFRYHPDPIDNLYRPSADQLAELFGSGVTVLERADVRETLQITHDIQRRGLWRYVGGMMSPWRNRRVWWGKLTHSLKRIEIACVFMQKAS